MIFTVTSSEELSGYVTTTVTGRVPGVVVSGLSLKVKVVFGGRSFSFVIISSGVRGDHLSTVLSSQVGLYVFASSAGGSIFVISSSLSRITSSSIAFSHTRAE